MYLPRLISIQLVISVVLLSVQHDVVAAERAAELTWDSELIMPSAETLAKRLKDADFEDIDKHGCPRLSETLGGKSKTLGGVVLAADLALCAYAETISQGLNSTQPGLARVMLTVLGARKSSLHLALLQDPAAIRVIKAKGIYGADPDSKLVLGDRK